MTIQNLPYCWILVAYLWVTGAQGWVEGYQSTQQRRLKPLSRIISYILWPAFSGVSIVGEWYTHLFPGKR